MIKILLLVIAIIAGVIVGPDLAGNQGYVLISIANHTIEMSVTTLFVGVLSLILALYILEFVLRKIFSVPMATSAWMSKRKINKARDYTHNGLIKLLEGDWRQAEKLVIKGVENSDTPLLNYLAAAESAQNLGDVESRDHYLQQASDFGGDNLATALTRAKLQYRQGQYEEALASLKGLQVSHPRNKMLLALLKETHIKLNDWQALIKLLPTLIRSEIITDKEAASIEMEAECGLMTHIATNQGSDGLLKHWNTLSRASKQQIPLIHCLASQLISQNADNEAYSVLINQIKKQPDNSLLALIPQLTLTDYHPVISKLEDLVRGNETNAAIHSVLGQLYFRADNWQQARIHFEQALEAQPDVNDYAWLVNTLEKLDDSGTANLISRQALKIALPNKVS